MRKALVIPKAAAALVCLIVALVISAPVLGVVSNKFFGGGTLDFNTEAYSEYRENRPVGGVIYNVLGAEAADNDGALSNGSYYYLVPLKGQAIDNKNKIDTLVLVKTVNGSPGYVALNDVFRASSSNGGSGDGYELSGVLKAITSDEKAVAEALKAKTPYGNLKLSEYTLDITVPVKSMIVRFLISLIFAALTVFAVILTIQAINKNADIDKIEDERMAYRMEQERKSGNKNEDGSDKMFGDSDASYGVTPRKEGGNDMLGEDSSGGSGGFSPAFQSQGGEDPFAGSMLGGSSGGFLDDSDYSGSGGFLDDSGYSGGQGGGFLDDGGYSGGQGGFYGAPEQNNKYDEDGFFGG